MSAKLQGSEGGGSWPSLLSERLENQVVAWIRRYDPGFTDRDRVVDQVVDILCQTVVSHALPVEMKQQWESIDWTKLELRIDHPEAGPAVVGLAEDWIDQHVPAWVRIAKELEVQVSLGNGRDVRTQELARSLLQEGLRAGAALVQMPQCQKAESSQCRPPGREQRLHGSSMGTATATLLKCAFALVFSEPEVDDPSEMVRRLQGARKILEEWSHRGRAMLSGVVGRGEVANLPTPVPSLEEFRERVPQIIDALESMARPQDAGLKVGQDPIALVATSQDGFAKQIRFGNQYLLNLALQIRELNVPPIELTLLGQANKGECAVGLLHFICQFVCERSIELASTIESVDFGEHTKALNEMLKTDDLRRLGKRCEIEVQLLIERTDGGLLHRELAGSKHADEDGSDREPLDKPEEDALDEVRRFAAEVEKCLHFDDELIKTTPRDDAGVAAIVAKAQEWRRAVAMAIGSMDRESIYRGGLLGLFRSGAVSDLLGIPTEPLSADDLPRMGPGVGTHAALLQVGDERGRPIHSSLENWNRIVVRITHCLRAVNAHARRLLHWVESRLCLVGGMTPDEEQPPVGVDAQTFRPNDQQRAAVRIMCNDGLWTPTALNKELRKLPHPNKAGKKLGYTTAKGASENVIHPLRDAKWAEHVDSGGKSGWRLTDAAVVD